MTNYYTIIIRIIYYTSRIQPNIAVSLQICYYVFILFWNLNRKISFASGVNVCTQNRPLDRACALSRRAPTEKQPRRGWQGWGARKTWRGAREKRRVIHPCGNIAREHTWPELQLQLQPPVTDRGWKGEGKTSGPKGRSTGHHGFYWPVRGGGEGGWSGCWDFSYAVARQRFSDSTEPANTYSDNIVFQCLVPSASRISTLLRSFRNFPLIRIFSTLKDISELNEMSRYSRFLIWILC